MRFFLDGTQYDAPKGWQEIQSKIELDEDLQLLTLVDDADLEFGGAAYAYLKTKLDEGFCQVIELRIEQNCYINDWVEVIHGKIFLTDIIFNERTCLAKCKIEDNGFFSSINNNSGLQTVPDAGLSKLGDIITPATVYTVDFYNTTANAFVRSVPCVRVYEALRALVAFMTDGAVGFASSLFEVGGVWEGLCITTGNRIRTGSAVTWEPFSFQNLFAELRARIPVRMVIDNPLTSPVLRIEDESYFRQSGVTTSIDNIYEITTRCDINKLYSKVKVGSSPVDDTATLKFPEDINYFGFKPEEFFLKTECNTKAELELQGDWAVGSNAIEKTLAGSQDLDDTLFLVDTTLTSTTAGRTKNENFLNLAPPLYYYNSRLTNEKILERYINGLPTTIVKYIAAYGTGFFEARTNAVLALNNTYSVLPIPFPNEITDPSNYFTGTDTYTAGNAGIYDFELSLNYTITALTPTPPSTNAQLSVRPFLRQYDSTGTQVAIIGDGSLNIKTAIGTYTTTINVRANMRQGDYVRAFVTLDPAFNTYAGTINVGSYFLCNKNTNGGGEFQVSDGKDYPVYIHEFEYTMTQDEFNALLVGARNFIKFRQNGQQWRFGRIKEVNYNRNAGKATFKLFSSFNDQINGN